MGSLVRVSTEAPVVALVLTFGAGLGGLGPLAVLSLVKGMYKAAACRIWAASLGWSLVASATILLATAGWARLMAPTTLGRAGPFNFDTTRTTASAVASFSVAAADLTRRAAVAGSS